MVLVTSIMSSVWVIMRSTSVQHADTLARNSQTTTSISTNKGGIATVAIFVFIFSWNELLIALFFTVSESRTFPIFISAQVSQAQIIWGNVAAATVIQSIPPILLTIFLQKNIVSGLTLGAVKN